MEKAISKISTFLLIAVIIIFGIFYFTFYQEGFSSNYDYKEKIDSGTRDLSQIQSQFQNKYKNKYYNNYNHYSGESMEIESGSVYTDALGDTITVNTTSGGLPVLVLKQKESGATMVLSADSDASTTEALNEMTFYTPIGNVYAKVIADSAFTASVIELTMATGEIVLFRRADVSEDQMTSTQYYGSTGTVSNSAYSDQVATAYSYPPPPPPPPAYNGPYSSTAGSVSGPYGGSAGSVTGPYGGSAGSVTGPYGNSAYYAQTPNGTTAVAATTNTSNATYYSEGGADAIPGGIPKSQIPPGQEDLYVLKSEIVPPVCNNNNNNNNSGSSSDPYNNNTADNYNNNNNNNDSYNNNNNSCPPCPACARCPEPSFECKKVPNYNAAAGSDMLPIPVLADFSQFGM